MELFSILNLMESCNPDATLDISTNCKHEVTLCWYFIGISHSIQHLKVHQIKMDCIQFQRALHAARCVMRCRTNLRKLYQNHPKIHAQVMGGALR